MIFPKFCSFHRCSGHSAIAPAISHRQSRAASPGWGTENRETISGIEAAISGCCGKVSQI